MRDKQRQTRVNKNDKRRKHLKKKASQTKTLESGETRHQKKRANMSQRRAYNIKKKKTRVLRELSLRENDVRVFRVLSLRRSDARVLG